MNQRRRCENAGCSLHGFEVETEVTHCLMCGRELKVNAVDRLMDAMEQRKRDRMDSFVDMLAEQFEKRDKK